MPGGRIACQLAIVLKDQGETVAWRARHAYNRAGDLRDPISVELRQEIETLSRFFGKSDRCSKLAFAFCFLRNTLLARMTFST